MCEFVTCKRVKHSAPRSTYHGQHDQLDALVPLRILLAGPDGGQKRHPGVDDELGAVERLRDRSLVSRGARRFSDEMA